MPKVFGYFKFIILSCAIVYSYIYIFYSDSYPDFVLLTVIRKKDGDQSNRFYTTRIVD